MAIKAKKIIKKYSETRMSLLCQRRFHPPFLNGKEACRNMIRQLVFNALPSMTVISSQSLQKDREEGDYYIHHNSATVQQEASKHSGQLHQAKSLWQRSEQQKAQSRTVFSHSPPPHNYETDTSPPTHKS